MLVMGGMAVKTVAIADPDDSYSLTIEKKVTGIPDGEKNTYEDVEYTFKYEISGGKSGTIKLKDGETKTIEDVNGPCTVTIEEIIDENIKGLGNYELETDKIKYESAADNTSGKVKLSVEGSVTGASAASSGIYVGENGKITIELNESQVKEKSYLYRILDAEESTIENEDGEGELSKDNPQISVEGLRAGNYFIKMAEKPEASDLHDPVSDVPIVEKEGNIIPPEEQNEIKKIETEETGIKEPEEEENPENTEENIKHQESETQTDSNIDDTPEISSKEILDEDVARASINDVQEDASESDSAGDPDGDDTSKNDPEGNVAEDDTSKNDPEGTDTDEDNITENDEDNPVESNDNENDPAVDELEIGADNGIMFASSEGDPEYTYSGFNVSYSYNETGNVFENIVYSENVTITVDTTELTAGNYQVKITGEGIEEKNTPFEKKEDSVSKSFAEFAGYTDESSLLAGTYRMEVTDGSKPAVSSNDNKAVVTLGDGNPKHIKLICTNPYEEQKLGAYNIVHEYYVNEITSRDAKECEGISSITIKEDKLGTNVTGEEVPKVLKFGNYTYEYVEDKNAYGYGKEDVTVSGNSPKEKGSVSGNNGGNNKWEPVEDYQEEAGKTSAIVQEAGNEVVILKYVRTTDPGKPDKPDEPDLPDPNDPDSPPTVTIPDGDVPRTYVRVWDPQKEEWVYLPEDEVPLAGRTSAKTADSMAPVFWMFMTGMSVAGVGIFHYNKKKKEE